MPAKKPFVFICGPDDFLVNRMGKQRFDALAQEGGDEFSREILSGFAGNVGDVEVTVNRLRESVQTISMFGGKRVVWLKDVNFLADSVTGRAESTAKHVEDLQALLGALDPEEVSAIVTAAPVDRRRSFPKWCEKNADFTLIGGDSDQSGEALAGIVLAEARSLGVTFGAGGVELLVAKIGGNTRLLIEEVNKLATYVAAGEAIEESHVAELTPNVAEGGFFEAAEAFFSGNLKWTLDALHRHFFSGGDARSVISALQNRNRIVLQLRALLDAGEIKLGPWGIDKGGFERAAISFGSHFGEASEKNSYNVFTQNLWYLGKLAGSAKLLSLRRLIDNQQEFMAAFEAIIQRPNEQEDVLRETAVRCLA